MTVEDQTHIYIHISYIFYFKTVVTTWKRECKTYLDKSKQIIFLWFSLLFSVYNFETNNTNTKWNARKGIRASCITSWALAPSPCRHHSRALRLRVFEGFSSRAGHSTCLLYWHSSFSTRAWCEYSRWMLWILFQHVVVYFFANNVTM